MSVARQACKTVYAGSIPAVASTNLKPSPSRRPYRPAAFTLPWPDRPLLRHDLFQQAVSGPRNTSGPGLFGIMLQELAMTIEQDVQDLKTRLAALERMLAGDRIVLRAGGASLTIHSGGIDIDCARLNITADQNVQITAGSAVALTAGSQCAITVGGRLEITAGSQYFASAGSGVQIESGNDVRLTARGQVQATANGQLRLTAGNQLVMQTGRTLQVLAANDMEIKTAKTLKVDARDELEVKVGDSSVTAKKSGDIAVKGKDVAVQASGQVNCKASKDIVLKGSKILQN
jgi:uncharacterized protein (DUF2345 family)